MIFTYMNKTQQMNPKSIQNFLTEQNVNMLVDIIMDEDVMRTQPTEVIKETEAIFYNNIRGFYENEKANAYDLFDLNKQYMLLILRRVKSDLIKKPEVVAKRQQHVTFEDIQSDRRSQFERDLTARQSEFTSAMTLPVPPVPKFSDAAQDEPLSEMELAIKQMTEQRNYDVEQITNSFTVNALAPPMETSVNNDKFKKPQIKPQQNQGVRYIKIEKNEAIIDDASIVDLSKQDADSTFERNIFNKLKRVDDTTVLQNEVKELRLNVDTIKHNIEAINRNIAKMLEMLTNRRL